MVRGWFPVEAGGAPPDFDLPPDFAAGAIIMCYMVRRRESRRVKHESEKVKTTA